MARRKRKSTSISFGSLLLVFILLFVIQVPAILVTIVCTVIGAAVLYGIYLWYRKSQQKKKILDWKKRVLQSGIQEIDVMKGEDFEQYLKVLLESIGCTVHLTPKSGDFGADLILENKAGNRIAVQAKRYERTVSVNAVQEVIASKSYYKTSEAWVITNQYFSPAAQKLAEEANVRLIDRDRLIKLITDAQNNKLSNSAS